MITHNFLISLALKESIPYISTDIGTDNDTDIGTDIDTDTEYETYLKDAKRQPKKNRALALQFKIGN